MEQRVILPCCWWYCIRRCSLWLFFVNVTVSRIWVRGLWRKFTKERKEACNQKAGQKHIPLNIKRNFKTHIWVWSKAKELGKEKTCVKYIDKKGKERVKGSRSLKSSQSSPWYLLFAFGLSISKYNSAKKAHLRAYPAEFGQQVAKLVQNHKNLQDAPLVGSISNVDREGGC